MNTKYDAVIIGSGPNGLSAGILLAQNGLSVKIIEAEKTIGGGTRTKELTEPGYLHDVCSAIHPTAAGSPFFNTLPLHKFGLEWIHPKYPVAHPLDDGEAVLISKSIQETIDRLGGDGKNYKDLFNTFVENWSDLSQEVFGSLRSTSHPFLMARFGWYAMYSAKLLGTSIFNTPEAKAYFAGLAAHSFLPLDKAFSASFGLVLGASVHSVGWPLAKGGSSSISDALASYFESLGGEIETERRVTDIRELPPAKAILFDLTPKQIVKIAASKLPAGYQNQLRSYTYGPGVFKIDYALSEPVPWLNEECKQAGTLHLGASFEELALSEKLIWENKHSEKPYVLIAQPSPFDATRAPSGKHVLWAYCHVPHGSTKDMTIELENQIERFAPGFRDIIIAKHTMNTADFERYNANYIGGDINGGAQFMKQILARPVLRWDPYKMPAKGLYICSSSTPPGGGVHGMSGYNAAKSALKKTFNIKV